MKLLGIIKDLLGEGGVRKEELGKFSINSSSLNSKDYFFIAKKGSFVTRNGIPIYFSLYPNREALPGNTPKQKSIYLNSLLEDIKDMNGLSTSTIENILGLSVANYSDPNDPYKPVWIVGTPTSAPIVDILVESLRRRFYMDKDAILTNLIKKRFYIKDLKNVESYNKADPGTKKIFDDWIEKLKIVYNDPGGDRVLIEPKKSGDKKIGLPPLIGGGRNLLNPIYAFVSDVFTEGKIVVVDDDMIKGSSLRNIFDELLKKGVKRSNIMGYVFVYRKEE